MVELALPKNSRMQLGKTWPKPANATRLKEYQ
ncbi:succinate dehydrogenase iron-sulfur subunit, partial [Prosthecomicrobium hirschii]